MRLNKGQRFYKMPASLHEVVDIAIRRKNAWWAMWQRSAYSMEMNANEHGTPEAWAYTDRKGYIMFHPIPDRRYDIKVTYTQLAQR